MKLTRKGKVCDIYDLGDMLLLKYTNRLSAFDNYICDIPDKGKNLARINRWWLEKTKHIIPNHLVLQDENSMLVKKCTPIPLEIVVRGYITGNTRTALWTHYNNGERVYCGIKFPDGLVKNQKLENPVVTPTTKSEKDEPISPEDILIRGILTEDELYFVYKRALELYNFGVEVVKEKGLILVDTKYEFGRFNDEIILMDEVHTCDSSRYWELESYQEMFEKHLEPERLDKDIIRNYIVEHSSNIPQSLIYQMSFAYKTFYSRLVLLEGEKLKYGCNPHQQAWVENPSYNILNGNPGYINYLDAVNAWCLVSDVRKSLDYVCVASFKHVSPAGVAIYGEMDNHLKSTYGDAKSKIAITFLRARDVDPKSSFGDFIAISHKVDVETATFIKGFVSDGIIAPSYEDEALEILKQKKGGKYIVLEANENLNLPYLECKEFGGISLCQTLRLYLLYLL